MRPSRHNITAEGTFGGRHQEIRAMPSRVLIDLEFMTVTQAEPLLATMRKMWSSGAAGPALGGEPRTQILETMEVAEIEA